MKRLAAIVAFSILLLITAASQSKQKFWEKKNDFGFLSMGSNYSNKASLFGTFNPLVQQSSLLTYASFYSKNQTDIMLTGIYTTNADTGLESSTTIFSFSLGKEFSLSETFSVNFLFDKYFYPETQNTLNPNYTDVLSVMASYNPTYFWSSIQFDVLNSVRSDYSLSVTLSPIITIEKLFHHSLSASILPYVSMDFSSKKYIQTAYSQLLDNPVSGIQYFQNAESIWKEISENVNQQLTELENSSSRNFGPAVRNSLSRYLFISESQAYLNELYEQEKAVDFGLSSFTLSIPITLYIANFGAGFSYSWYMPKYKSNLFYTENIQYFSFDLAYIKTIQY